MKELNKENIKDYTKSKEFKETFKETITKEKDQKNSDNKNKA